LGLGTGGRQERGAILITITGFYYYQPPNLSVDKQ